MTEARDEISQQKSQIRRWIKNFLGVIFVALLFFVLFKVLTLSKDVEESRRMLKELSSRLVKAQGENEDLRKELRHTKAKVENIVRKFSSAQKVPVARVRRSRRHACHRIKDCLQTYTKDLTQRSGIRSADISHFINHSWSDGSTAVPWQKYFNNGTATIPDYKHIKIHRGGYFFVYCSLTVGSKYIREVSIKTYHRPTNTWKTLFTSLPRLDSNNSAYEVRLSGLAEIVNETKLYVEVKFRDEWPSNALQLFPYLGNNNNNFGVFLFS